MENVAKKLRVSTDSLSPKDAKAYWADYVADICHGIKIDFPKDETVFRGSIERIDFGPATLFDFKLDQNFGERLPCHIARDGVDCFSILSPKKGSVFISKSESEISVKSSRTAFFDIGSSFYINIPERSEFSALFFDKIWLRSILPSPESLLWRDLSAESGWGRALAAIMTELSPAKIDHFALPPQVMVDQIATLLALAAGPAVDPLKSSQRTFLKRLRRDMQDRLQDPLLDPAGFAHDQGIAKRTLHALFAQAGSSFMEELIAMRLDRARSLLGDRRFNNKTIGEIATMVGFSNANHFAIRFRKAYGQPPREYRSLANKT